MTQTKPSLSSGWTWRQALLLSAVCLVAGIAGGWRLSLWQYTAKPVAANPGGAPEASAPAASIGARNKAMADAQAAPMAAQLRSDPGTPTLLTGLGNLYYDAQQYTIAVDYYGRALKAKPADAAVRTDMATAYWYMGDADRAIAEFNQALLDAPDNANTLFNLGLVKWQGKHDAAGATAAWQKLLAAHPDYENRAKVEQMLRDAKRSTPSAPAN